MGWKNLAVDAGFGGGEETMRFGPRNEKGSSLYQVDTLACISQGEEEEPSGIPLLMAIASQFGVSLVVENNVLVFGESCSTHQVTFSFDSLVNCITWTEDGSFLAIGESSGKLSLAYVPSGKILWDQVILDHNDNDDRTFRSLMFCKLENGISELEILPAHGCLIRLKDLNLSKLETALSEDNQDEIKEMQTNLSRDVVNLSIAHSVSFDHITTLKDGGDQQLLVSGQGGNGVSVWEKDNFGHISLTNIAADYFDQEIGFLKCIPSPNDDFIVVLDTEHHLSIWSAALLTPISFWEDVEVDDVILYSTSSVGEDGRKSGSTMDIKIVILTKRDSKKSLLQVYSLPNFDHVYTLQVSACARLASVQTQLDGIYFIEGVEDELKNDSFNEYPSTELEISTIRLRCLNESSPDSRFKRLLHKEKFELAKEFAKQFNLEVELVYCVKANAILDQISPWGKSAPKSEEEYEIAISELKECLDMINDASHIINCALHAELPTLHTTYDLLKYAKERIDAKEGGWSSTPSVQSLIDGLNRLVTFQVAFGAKNFSIATWKQFVTASLLDEIINCFKSDVTAGIVIWRRHQPELEQNFCLKKLEELLRSIPESVPSAKIIQWLREDFVPFVLTKFPDGQMILAKWLETRARNMEVSEKDSWPNNALELAEVMFKAFSNVAKTTYDRGNATPAQFAMQVCKLSIPCSLQGKDNQVNSENSLAQTMAKLADLVTCLREISALHSEFSCKLSLYCYKKENTKTIAFRLLDRVLAPELIANTIEKYVKPYAKKHNLSKDHLLLDYVKDLIARELGQVRSLWILKVIVIIDCIKNQELKCQATLQVMSTAAIPWSSDVRKLVKSMMETHPNNEALKQQNQFAELKTTMMKYGTRNYNIADFSKGMGTMHYIFTCDTETAVADAMQVVKTYQIHLSYLYFFRLKTWILKDKIEECCDLLRSLDTKLAIESGDRIISWVFAIITDPPSDELDKKRRITCLKASTEIIRTLSSLDSNFKDERKEELLDLKRISSLQTEFDVYVSMEDYNNQSKKDEIWKMFLTEKQKENKKLDSHARKTEIAALKLRSIRLGQLLGFNETMQKQHEVFVYLEQGDIRNVLRILRDSKKGIAAKKLLDLFKETLIHLLTEPWHRSEKEDVFQWLSYINHADRISCFASSVANKDELRDFLEIHKLLRLAVAVSEQCESADYEQDAFRQTDAFAKWNLTDRYEDEGMVLNSRDVIPLLRKYFKACFFETDRLLKYESMHLSGGHGKVKALEDVGLSNNAIVKLLQENNLQVAALEFMVQAIGTSMMNVNNTKMGFQIHPEHQEQAKSNEQALLEILPIALKNILETSNILLTKILSHHHVDCDFALGHLCTISTNQGVEIMAALKEKFGSKYRRIETAARIGIDYAGLKNNLALLNSCIQLQDSAYWGRQFVSLKISPKDVYKLARLNNEEMKALIRKLVSSPNFDVPTLIKFCLTVHFEEDPALLMYITSLLLPNRSSKATCLNEDKINEAMSRVKSSDNLYSLLQSSLKQISPYDYERISFVLRKMNEIKPNTLDKMIVLVECLSNYERSSQPQEYEISYLSQTEEEQFLQSSSSVPEAAKTRLPFHPLLDGHPWKILSPELKSESTVRKMENIAHCIKLDLDELYTTSIHKIVSHQLQLDNQGRCKIQQDNEPFEFGTVEGLLRSVSNPQMAIAAAKWVAKLLPTGEAKVKALKSCVGLCKNLEKRSDEDELQKMKDWSRRLGDLCRRTETEVVLDKYGVATEEYKNLSQSPASLICKLYEDFGCKAEIVNGRVVGIPDIHALAEEIADINCSSIGKIHVYLLQKWLPSCHKSRSNDGDTTLQLDVSMMFEEDETKIDEKNLKRVIYIFNSSTQEQNARFLLPSALGESSPAFTHMCRMRALQALFTLVSVSNIELIAGRTLDQIRHYLTSLIYLAELEQLNLPQTMAAFLRCSKEGLIKGLWRNHSHEPKGVRLIADLCLDYNIYDPQLWNILLPQFLSFGMTDYLRHTLVALSGIPELREIPCLPKMWRGMILAPFSNVSSIPPAGEEELLCLESANLLQRCPVILDLDLKDIADRFYNIKMYTQALSCLSLIPDGTTRNQCLKKLLQDVGCFTVLDRISEERKRGRQDGYLDHVEEEVFYHVNKQQLFKEMSQSRHFSKFVNYLISSDQLNNLLLQTIKSDRIKNAVQLVELYDRNPPPTATRRTNHNLKGIPLLMVYLQDHGLFEEAVNHIPASFG